MKRRAAAFAFRAREAWLATGLRLPVVAARWLFQREYLVTVRETDRSMPEGPAGSVRWTPIDDPTRLSAKSRHPALASEEVRRRLLEGQEGWAGWLDGHLAHWRWETTGETYLPYLGKRFRPQQGDLCVVEVYTDPRFRGRGLYTAATLLALRRARQRGLTRLIGMVAWWNDPARHVMEVKAGRTIAGSVGYWGVAGWRRYYTRGLVRLDEGGVVTVVSLAAD